MRMKWIVMPVAVFSAAFALLSCSRTKEEDFSKEEKIERVYTLTVQAAKSGDTKALTVDGNVIKTSWKAEDIVSVYNTTGDKLGELIPEVSGTSTTTLSGQLTTAPAVDDVLTLKFSGNNYTTQQGTIEYIAANCDYALADVTVTSVTGLTIQTTMAHFESQQAIVKFTLTDNDTTPASLAATQFVFNDGTNNYTITPPAASSELYVALPAFSDKTVTITAQVGAAYYEFTKANTSFEKGQYYRVTARLKKQKLQSLSFVGLDAPVPTYYFGGALQGEAR